jgi:hypothetical protein
MTTAIRERDLSRPTNDVMVVPAPDARPINGSLKNPRSVLDTDRTWAIALQTG